MCILYFCWLDSNQYFLIIIIIEERERENNKINHLRGTININNNNNKKEYENPVSD